MSSGILPVCGHAYARSGGWIVVPVSRVPCAARPSHVDGRADRRAARRRFDVAPDSRRRQARLLRRRVRRAGQDVSRRLVSAIQGESPADAGRSRAPDRAAARSRPRARLAAADAVDGVEADDVIGTLGDPGAAAGIALLVSTSDKDLAQLVRPGITLVNTMSNETLDEEGVVAKFGVRADQVLDLLALDRRCRRQRARRAEGRAEDRGEVARAIRLARRDRRARERDPRRRRRKPARGARLAAAGQAPADGEDRLRAAGDARRSQAGRAATRRASRRSTSASSSRAGCATFDDGSTKPMSPGRSRTAPRGRTRAVRRRGSTRRRRRKCRRPSRGTTRPCSIRNLRALDGGNRARRARLRRHRDDEPRPDGSEDRRRCRSRSSPDARATSRSPTAILARRTSWRRTWCSRGSRRGSPILRGGKLGQNVKYDQHVLRQSRHRARGRSRTTRCSSPTCSRRTGRTTSTISRGGISM